jgi:hypothetical protein
MDLRSIISWMMAIISESSKGRYISNKSNVIGYEAISPLGLGAGGTPTGTFKKFEVVRERRVTNLEISRKIFG